jgi:hypothetical protein
MVGYHYQQQHQQREVISACSDRSSVRTDPFKRDIFTLASCWVCNVEAFWIYIRNDEAKVFKTFIRNHSLLKSERLRANIKLTFHMPLIRSVMTYACPAWEFAAGTCLF